MSQMRTIREIAESIGRELTPHSMEGRGLLGLFLLPGRMSEVMEKWQAAGDWSAYRRLVSTAEDMAQVLEELHEELSKELPGVTEVARIDTGLVGSKPIGARRKQTTERRLERGRREISKILGRDMALAWVCPNQVVLVDDSNWEFSVAMQQERERCGWL